MGGVLKYNQAKVKFFRLIAERHLQAGDRLPPERELVAEFGLSLITVRRAMRELEEENIIERRPRSGTWLRHTFTPQDVPEQGYLLYLKIYREDYGEDSFQDVLSSETEMLLKKDRVGFRFRAAGKPDPEIAELASGSMGIFVIGWLDDKWRDFLKSLRVPVVVIGNSPYPDAFSIVNYDFRSAAELCHTALLESGCRRTALINGGRTYLTAYEIREGFRQAAHAYGLDPEKLPLIWTSQTRIGEDLTGFLRKHRDLDGVLVESGEVDALLGCLWQTGYSRSLKIAVITDSKNVIRPFSTVPQGFAACFRQSLAQCAVRRMREKISGDTQEITCDLIPVFLFRQDKDHILTFAKTGETPRTV